MLKKYSLIIALIFSMAASSKAGTVCSTIGGTILNDVTLNVPSDYGTIQEALDCISDKVIADGATVTIQVANGTYNSYQTINVSHANGDKIQILGDTVDPSNVVLNFATGTRGLTVSDGNTLGLINGFTLNGTDSTGTTGLLASQSSSITCGASVVISDFQVGVYATRNSSIICNNIETSSNLVNGIYAEANSSVQAQNASSNSNGTYGVAALYESYIIFTGGTVDGNSTAGIYSSTGSLIHGGNSTVKNNTGIGIHATKTGNVYIPTAPTYSGNGTNSQQDANSLIYN